MGNIFLWNHLPSNLGWVPIRELDWGMTTKVDIYRQAAWRHKFCKATNSLFEPGAIDPSGIELAHP